MLGSSATRYFSHSLSVAVLKSILVLDYFTLYIRLISMWPTLLENILFLFQDCVGLYFDLDMFYKEQTLYTCVILKQSVMCAGEHGSQDTLCAVLGKMGV